MMTSFTDEVRDTVSPYKFSDDRRAAALYVISLSGGMDEYTGDVQWDVWCGRYGRTLLLEDGRGFVWCVKYATVAEAEAEFNRVDAAYCEWDDAP